ncbi:MAG: molecular chaperone DnaK [Synechococcales bacterium]|nr:molecular chaperone DnaK [Cyanobacteria bacterium REEB444]MEB3124531.1 molecular chaperone DnaK [Synechococcales bacterium]
MGRVVGIDLGTTNSVVAVMEGGKPIVIANVEGSRTTPSVVGFSKDGELLVGQMARRQTVLNPSNTFYAIKRFMGRKYNELSLDSKRVPYTIRRDDGNNIKIKCPKLDKEFAPEELSAMILRKLAEEASHYLGEPVTGAVITVPAYFNDSQRQATRDAGRIAGLEVKRILNEPTAASLAYGLNKKENKTILVYDLGGGTFDVSLLEVGDGVFEVKSTSGDTQLGGDDFDKRIVDWLAEQFQEQEGMDLRRDRQSLQRLTEAAEKAKIELSGVSVTEINLPFITATEDGPKHLETRLTRPQFEELAADLIDRLRSPVKRVLGDAGMGPDQIDEVVLVGGSTRIPMVQQLVRKLIDREPNQNVNPDEVVAVGAAIQAGILAGEIKDILLLDVTPLSLGLETANGMTKKLIPRNTTIPVRRADTFSTASDNQTLVEVHVLQGEREVAVDNKSLGRFKLSGIPPAPRGVPQVQVAFDIDANGILQVTAVDRTTGRDQSLTIQGASTSSREEVERMIQDAEKFAEVDRARREKVEKRSRAESIAYQAERKLREVALDYGLYFASDRRKRIETLIRELRDNLTQNDERGIDLAQAGLQDALYDLNRELMIVADDDDDEDFFEPLKNTLAKVKNINPFSDRDRGRDRDNEYRNYDRYSAIDDNSSFGDDRFSYGGRTNTRWDEYDSRGRDGGYGNRDRDQPIRRNDWDNDTRDNPRRDERGRRSSDRLDNSRREGGSNRSSGSPRRYGPDNWDEKDDWL